MDPILRRSSLFHMSALVVFVGILARRLFWDQWPAFELIPLLMPVYVIGGLAHSESGECYGFLRLLPVSGGDLVRRKFALILLVSLGYWLFMMVAALVRRGDGTTGDGTLVYLTLVCAAGLLLAACCQVGLWHYGRSFLAVLGVAAAVMLVVMVIHMVNLKRTAGWPALGEAGPVTWLAGAPWISVIVLIGLSLGALYGLARLGERVLAGSEAHL